MTPPSSRLSVTPIGSVVAQSVLHPRSAIQLIEYTADRANDLLALTNSETDEQTLRYALLHAAYSSDEYSNRGGAKALPYQLNPVVQNDLADQAEPYLIEHPWVRNPKSANAALLAMRWAKGERRNALSPEFEAIGSGVLQAMFRESTEILFALSDCLIAGTAPHLTDADRPEMCRGNADRLRDLRNLASVIRTQAIPLVEGLPGEVAWLARLTVGGTGPRLLSRTAIMALFTNKLTAPSDLLRHEKFGEIVKALQATAIPDRNKVVENLRSAVRDYEQDRRQNLWKVAIDRAPEGLKALLEETLTARGKRFETKIEALLNAVDIAYERLDDGRTPGAPDFCLGLNHGVQVVTELKTADGEGTVGLNEATDVIKGAAIVNLEHLPKATLANPGFDPNAHWQARKVRDLALVEACQFVYGISLLACNEVDTDAFLNWLAQPGLLSIRQLLGSGGRGDG